VVGDYLRDDCQAGCLLDNAGSYRTLIAAAIFLGLRLSELLGLVWADVDFEAGLVRVRKQLGRDGRRVAPKTPLAVREVVLMPALAKLSREHREQAFGRGHASADDFVFAFGDWDAAALQERVACRGGAWRRPRCRLG
jgi:integrase